MPLNDPSLDYRNDLTHRLKQKDHQERFQISVDAIIKIVLNCAQCKYMTNTLFLGNPNFSFNCSIKNLYFLHILSFFLPSMTSDGKQGEPLWDMIAKYYETNVTNIQNDFPVWNPEFGTDYSLN